MSQRPPARFHGASAPVSTVEQLRAYDAMVPQWGIGETDDQGRWIPVHLPGLMVVAPHPDDELLGATALIAAALRTGAPVLILAVTDGTGSHSPGVVAADRLAEIRTAEAEAALTELSRLRPVTQQRGQINRRRLSLVDGDVAAAEPLLIDTIGEALSTMPPGTMLTAPLLQDGHPDHEASGRAAASAAQKSRTALVYYPVWLWHHTPLPPTPPQAMQGTASTKGVTFTRATVPWAAARAVPIDAELQRARWRGLAHFQSQVTTNYGGPRGRRPGEPVLTRAALSAVLRETQILFPSAPADFEAMHQQHLDPWRVADRWYEQRKRNLTMSVLPRPRYHRVYEPGCSVGVLTRQLADRADHLIASDISEAAIETAAARLSPDFGPGALRDRAFESVAVGVEFRQASIEDWPDGSFDLIVLSEMAYYLDDSQWAMVLHRARKSLQSGGHLVATHWRHPISEAFRTAEQIRVDLGAVTGWVTHSSYNDADLLIDVVGPPTPSVAETEFLCSQEQPSSHQGSD